jgi:hypothetical protein
LRTGEPGSLLIEGGRLWRSTEVTVGAQRATSIRVLPNMEAIIAEFRCVERPTTFMQDLTAQNAEAPTTSRAPANGDNRAANTDQTAVNKNQAPSDKLFRVPLHIWTSEGLAHQDYFVRIAVPDKYRSCSEAGAPAPQLTATASPGGGPQPTGTGAQPPTPAAPAPQH